MNKLFHVIAGTLLLAGCGGDSSDIEDFREFEKLGVIAGPTPKDHWQVSAYVSNQQLTLVYHNDGDEDFQWLQFSATDNNKAHIIFLKPRHRSQ